MNTTSYTEEKPFLNFPKWVFGTIFSIAIGSFLTLILSIFSHLSASVGVVVLWLTTTLFSYWAHRLATQSSFRARIPHLLFWLFISSAIGWTISLVLVYPTIHLSEPLLWRGFIAGGELGLCPGIFTGVAYYWLIRPYYDAMYLFVINVISWCLGMGFVVAGLLWLLNEIVNNVSFFL